MSEFCVKNIRIVRLKEGSELLLAQLCFSLLPLILIIKLDRSETIAQKQQQNDPVWITKLHIVHLQQSERGLHPHAATLHSVSVYLDSVYRQKTHASTSSADTPSFCIQTYVHPTALHYRCILSSLSLWSGCSLHYTDTYTPNPEKATQHISSHSAAFNAFNRPASFHWLPVPSKSRFTVPLKPILQSCLPV